MGLEWNWKEWFSVQLYDLTDCCYWTLDWMFVRSKGSVQLMISPLVAVSLVFISFFGVTRFETPGWVLQISCYFPGFFSGGGGSLNCGIKQCDATRYAMRPWVSSQHVCIFGLTVSISFLYLLLFQPSYTFSSSISFLWWFMIWGVRFLLCCSATVSSVLIFVGRTTFLLGVIPTSPTDLGCKKRSRASTANGSRIDESMICPTFTHVRAPLHFTCFCSASSYLLVRSCLLLRTIFDNVACARSRLGLTDRWVSFCRYVSFANSQAMDIRRGDGGERSGRGAMMDGNQDNAILPTPLRFTFHVM